MTSGGKHFVVLFIFAKKILPLAIVFANQSDDRIINSLSFDCFEYKNVTQRVKKIFYYTKKSLHIFKKKASYLVLSENAPICYKISFLAEKLYLSSSRMTSSVGKVFSLSLSIPKPSISSILN